MSALHAPDEPYVRLSDTELRQLAQASPPAQVLHWQARSMAAECIAARAAEAERKLLADKLLLRSAALDRVEALCDADDYRLSDRAKAYVRAAISHEYLSTGCYHGRHDYCAAMTGYQGEKRPGRCKFCDARCICPCHEQQRKEGPT